MAATEGDSREASSHCFVDLTGPSTRGKSRYLGQDLYLPSDTEMDPPDDDGQTQDDDDSDYVGNVTFSRAYFFCEKSLGDSPTSPRIHRFHSKIEQQKIRNHQ